MTEDIAERLSLWRLANKNQSDHWRELIGKNKITSNDEAWKDYEICFRELFDFVDYFVVNVSSFRHTGIKMNQEKDLT